MNPQILMIEDDASIRDMTKMNLNMNGFQQVYCASDGEEGLAMAAQLAPDLILLDVMLPGIDGLTVCRNLKNNPALADIPVIMLTAKGEENDVVLGLEIGADDYITKPYSSKVLAARIAVQLRKKRNGTKGGRTIVLGALSIDLVTHSVSLDGRPLTLTADEFKTLALLAANPGRVFTRNQIIREVKGGNYPVTARAIDMHMVNLRRKLGEWADHIETVRGVGYRAAGE
ncbi:response regulator transcription factor [uncultured Victivallis sp.]|uniref:response regulator n=1 Tax=uncultured Victivallis sp. TaxID=354118 RepID=UPI002588161D|nr:response regulator transcription factor [uncultured Victivallis sp.]